MTLQWLSVDLLSGRVFDLPGFVPDWPLRRAIGQVQQATGNLILDVTPSEWRKATTPLACALVLFDDEDPGKTIQWGGIVTRRVRTSGSGVVQTSLETGEHYFGRRSVSIDKTYNMGQNQIVAHLTADFVADAGGMPIVVKIVTPGDGMIRQQSYKGASYGKALDALTALSLLEGGPEWTLEWLWSSNNELLIPTLYVGDRIGVAAAIGLQPSASFDMPGCLIEVTLTEDFGDGKGATRVTAYSSGQGNSIPTSGPIDGPNLAGRPIVEFVYSPAASTPDVPTLQSFATKTVNLLAPGQQALTLTAHLSNAPRLGQAWRLGDDLQYNVDPVNDQGDPVLEFPDGLNGVGRAVGYELNADTISPILAQPSIPGA